jgi:hypothetical protein
MNILIQQTNNKFINNISSIELQNYNMYKNTINNNLYKLHYEHKIETVFFVESLLSNEILQYIAEFFQTIRIFIYHDKLPNKEIIESYKNACIHLVNPNFTKVQYTQVIPLLLNTKLYNNHNQEQKNNDIICFLDNLDTLSLDLKNLLYPNTKLKIKLFNNEKIHHPQNLGILTEKDKAKILKQSKYFLALDESYVTEALVSGCEVLDIKELSDMKPHKYVTIPKYISYETFMESIL